MGRWFSPWHSYIDAEINIVFMGERWFLAIFTGRRAQRTCAWRGNVIVERLRNGDAFLFSDEFRFVHLFLDNTFIFFVFLFFVFAIHHTSQRDRIVLKTPTREIRLYLASTFAGEEQLGSFKRLMIDMRIVRTFCVGFQRSLGCSPDWGSSVGGWRIDIHTSPFLNKISLSTVSRSVLINSLVDVGMPHFR